MQLTPGRSQPGARQGSPPPSCEDRDSNVEDEDRPPCRGRRTVVVSASDGSTKEDGEGRDEEEHRRASVARNHGVGFASAGVRPLPPVGPYHLRQKGAVSARPGERLARWGKGMDGQAIAVDGDGNVYITGFFEGKARLGPLTLQSNGEFDVFVAKLSPLGRLLWATTAGGGASDEGKAIALDRSGNAYVTGFFEGKVSFGATSLESEGRRAAFVAKVSPGGQFLWAVAATVAIEGVAVDARGNAYLVGSYEGTASFGTAKLHSQGRGDIFAAKVSPGGQFLWGVAAGEKDRITVEASPSTEAATPM